MGIALQRRGAVKVGALFVAVVAASAAIPIQAHALPFLSGPDETEISADLLRIGEIIIPDARLEIDENGRVSGVLTAPVDLVLVPGLWHPKLYMLLTIEPQVRPRDGTWRGVFSTRFDLGPFFFDRKALISRYGIISIFFEAGAVVAEDGHGGTGGGGACLGGIGPIKFTCMGYRATVTKNGMRHDFVLDFSRFPFLVTPGESWRFPTE